MKTLLALVIVVVFGAIAFFLLFGKGAPVSTAPAGNTAAQPTPAPQAVVTCYKCNGTGVVKCPNPKCVNGFVDCPGECLKLSVGNWEHLDIPGYPPDLLWRKFYASDGTWRAWSTHHIGEVIEMRNGVPVDIGKCPICGGSGKIPCSVCHGTGTITCPICGGRKVLPAGSATPFPAMNGSLRPQPTPEAANSPSHPAVYPEVIKLQNGKTIIGTIEISDDEVSWIRTSAGTVVQVPTKQIVSHSIKP